jgi:carbohydrate-selective porin OprB
LKASARELQQRADEHQRLVAAAIEENDIRQLNRDVDEIGIAVAHARISDKRVKYSGRDKSESTLEVTYRMAINKRIAFQPDVQVILNPGANARIKNAVVAGLRLEIAL